MIQVHKTTDISLNAAEGWHRLPTNVGRYPQQVLFNGRDIFMPAVNATCFGGTHDHGDDGKTASGIRTDVVGGVAGVALPMPAARACRGTPIPQLPWKTPVWVILGPDAVRVPLIDEGPAGGLSSRAMIDLTWPVVAALKPGRAIGPNAANWWSSTVAVLIEDVADYLKDYTPWGYEPPQVGMHNAVLRNG